MILEMINIFSDAVFTGKDLVMVVGGATVVLTAFLTLKSTVKENKAASVASFDKIKSDLLVEINNNKEALVILEQDVIHSKNGRKALREEVKEEIKERFSNYNDRVKTLETLVKENQDNNNHEFKDINEKLNKIIGMLEKK